MTELTLFTQISSSRTHPNLSLEITVFTQMLSRCALKSIQPKLTATYLPLQATHSGFSLINQDNVFKVCDQPHPILVGNLISHCLSAELDGAYGIMKHLCDLGYSATDIITTLFRVVRNFKMQEFLKLEFIKVRVLLACRARWYV